MTGGEVKVRIGIGAVPLVAGPGPGPELAALAALAPKRVLPVFGIRPAEERERALFPVPDGARPAVFDEAVVVVRRLLTERSVTHHGRFVQLDDAVVAPLPARPLDLWLSGTAPVGLRRTGRLGDGWLGSFVTPDEARAARATIEAAAAEAGRHIEDHHYGTNIAVLAPGTDPASAAAALAALARRRPGVDPTRYVADGWAQAREQVRNLVAAGLTKFVVRPAVPVASWAGFLDAFVGELMGLEGELSTAA